MLNNFDQYTRIFIDESKENLQKLNEYLLKLENNKEDFSLIDEIFRVAHTLKGMSQTMGYCNIGNLTHNMENMLDLLRSKQISLSDEIADILFKCLDRLESLLEDVEENNKDNVEIEDLINKISVLSNNENIQAENTVKNNVELNEYEKTVIEKAVNQNFDAQKIKIKFSDDCLLPSVRAYMAIQALENSGEIIKTVPSTEEIEQGNVEKEILIIFITQNTEEEINKTIYTISEIDKVEIQKIDNEISNAPEQITDSEHNGAETPVNNDSAEVKKCSKVSNHTLRINADRVDKLMNIVGELVTNKSQLIQVAGDLESPVLTSVSSAISNITSELQEIVINLRMIPVSNVFNRFPRLVRDISKDLGKEVNLKMEGEDTEIDRSVIDEISDPLVHIIKNSLDHGIELPEDRIKNDKPATGLLTLSASNEGDIIKIIVKDDGKGIDPNVVKKVAIKKGLITEEDSKKLSDQESIELLFKPGFSTAEKTSDLSGRGVGMDVVKSKISELGGNVAFDSELGKGTTITISLPSTLAITQSLLVKVATQTYAIPLNYISESVELNINEVKTIKNKEVIVLRNETIPLIRLDKLLGLEVSAKKETGVLNILIANIHSKLIGLVVSEVINQYEVVMKPIDDFIKMDKVISGATILGDGKVALILNVNYICEELKQEH